MKVIDITHTFIINNSYWTMSCLNTRMSMDRSFLYVAVFLIGGSFDNLALNVAAK